MQIKKYGTSVNLLVIDVEHSERNFVRLNFCVGFFLWCDKKEGKQIHKKNNKPQTKLLYVLL